MEKVKELEEENMELQRAMQVGGQLAMNSEPTRVHVLQAYVLLCVGQ